MRAMIHLRFAMELAKEQIAAGRYFVFEHPAMATSWSERCVKTIMEMPDVEHVLSHLCQFEYMDPRDGSPLKKPTRFMSNSEEISAALERKCTGIDGLCSRRSGGRHAHISGRRLARHSQVYTDELCKTMLHGDGEPARRRDPGNGGGCRVRILQPVPRRGHAPRLRVSAIVGFRGGDS